MLRQGFLTQAAAKELVETMDEFQAGGVRGMERQGPELFMRNVPDSILAEQAVKAGERQSGRVVFEKMQEEAHEALWAEFVQGLEERMVDRIRERGVRPLAEEREEEDEEGFVEVLIESLYESKKLDRALKRAEEEGREDREGGRHSVVMRKFVVLCDFLGKVFAR